MADEKVKKFASVTELGTNLLLRNFLPKYFGIPSYLILSLGTITPKESRKEGGGNILNFPDFMLSLDEKFRCWKIMRSKIKNLIQTITGTSRSGEEPIWAGDGVFLSLFKEIEDRTLVSIDRCFNLFQLARYAAHREGDIAEVGVYRGGTGRLLARTCPKKTIHLFDTFSGMPETDGEIDLHKKDDFSDSSLESVRAFLEDCPDISFHPGIFPASAAALRDRSFCFAHIDVDIYQSARASLEFFYPAMVPGGVMVFDDYEWEGCPGIKQALDEFLADKPESPIITTRYQCMLIKI
ncbi:MAG TPA: hypothetical protein ENH12_05370 [Proteobacteria bacterium]|nr:hypothetical protein [Pseudomonadota bacterium]